MSFDLWFASKKNSPDPTAQAIREWFEGRAHYLPENLSKNQAIYENEDTGVYFIFEFGEIFDPDDQPDTNRSIVSILLLNYLRPKFFAFECALEVQEFMDHFALEVCDPQEFEADFTAFDKTQFIESFSKHSRFAVKSIQENHGFEPKPVPSDTLESLWRWNFNKSELERQTIDDIFFPTMFIFEADHGLSTGIVWSDGIPTIIPPCETIYLHWDELAGSGILGLKFKAPKKDQLYNRTIFTDIFTEFYKRTDQHGCLWPRDVVRPAKLTKILRNFDQVGVNPVILQADSVIDDEFVTD